MHKIIAVAAGAAFAPAAFATQVALAPVQAPTLTEFGLGALVVVLAAVAGWVIRKRK